MYACAYKIFATPCFSFWLLAEMNNDKLIKFSCAHYSLLGPEASQGWVWPGEHESRECRGGGNLISVDGTTPYQVIASFCFPDR